MPNDGVMAGKIADARPAVASLFVWGAADQLVPPERSVQLMHCFCGRTEHFEHPGAHMVRCSAAAVVCRCSVVARRTLLCVPMPSALSRSMLRRCRHAQGTSNGSSLCCWIACSPQTTTTPDDLRRECIRALCSLISFTASIASLCIAPFVGYKNVAYEARLRLVS